MSYDDKRFMANGRYVRHAYKYRRKCHAVCERCGTKRRRTTSGYEYRFGNAPSDFWSTSNPACASREQS